MVQANIDIPEELEELASIFKINWQLAIGKMLKKKFERLSRVKSIVDKSKLTQEQVDELSDEVNLVLAKRYEKLLKEG
jgi:hypothetical protein